MNAFVFSYDFDFNNRTFGTALPNFTCERTDRSPALQSVRWRMNTQGHTAVNITDSPFEV